MPDPIVVPPIAPPEPPVAPVYDWSTQAAARHSTRLICDEMGLTVEQKNILCACLYQESQFRNSAICRNRNSKGVILSSDWGLAQVNDYYHIGPKKDFLSVEYVLGNCEQVIRWMIRLYKQGQLRLWVSYSSGAYKHWLPGVSSDAAFLNLIQ